MSSKLLRTLTKPFTKSPSKIIATDSLRASRAFGASGSGNERKTNLADATIANTSPLETVPLENSSGTSATIKNQLRSPIYYRHAQQQKGALDVTPCSHTELLRYPQCKISGLENGIIVATEHLPWNTDSVSVGVFVDAGSRYETAENNGSAHFLEHLAFKGTNNRSRDALELEVEDMGGHLNAYTSREQTVYYAQVLKENINQSVDILGDILQNSLLEKDAIEQERAVILQEMENVYDNTKEELVFDIMHENCFQDCNLGRTILGSVDNIKRINQEDLLNYIRTYYTGDNMVIVACGAIDDHEAFVNQVRAKFSKIAPHNANKPAKDKSYFVGCDYEERWDDWDYGYYSFAYPTCAWNDADSYPLMFMQQMLGQWDKRWPGGKHSVSPFTRFCYEKDERPAAENYMAFNTPYSDIGLFGIYGKVHPYDGFYFVEQARKEMNRFGYDVNVSMLDDTRERLKTTMLQSMGNTTQTMEMIGRELLIHGRRIHPAEAFARVNDVDVNSIKYAAHKYLIDRDHVAVAIGSVHEVVNYAMFRHSSYKFW